MAIPIPCKIDRISTFSDGRRKDTPIATSHGRRMAEAVGDIPVIVESLGRCDRYKTIYRTLDVAGHKNFCYDGFMEEATLRSTKE